jgi:hypothetical protein
MKRTSPRTAQPLGTAATFNAAMVAELRHVPLARGDWKGTRPLANARLEPDDGLLPAFLEATARVLDVLAFYEARLDEEAFPESAQLPRTRTRMAQSLGGALELPYPSHTWFSFTVRGGSVIPAGTQAQTASGATPVVFETDADLVASQDWNTLRPTPRVPPPVPPGGPVVVLASASTGVRKGDLLLLTAAAGLPPSLHTATDVTRLGKAAMTAIAVDPPLPSTAAATTPSLSLLSRPRALAGATTPPFADAIASRKLAAGAHRAGGVALLAPRGSLTDPAAWQARTQGAPPGGILALSATADGTLVCGTAGDGVLVWPAGAAGWSLGPPLWRRQAVNAFAIGPFGWVSAAPANGGVGSTQDGQLWTTAGADTTRALLGGVPRSVPPFRALADAGKGAPQLVGAAETGVWTLEAAGTWTPVNKGLPGAGSPQATPQTVIRGLVRVGSTLVLATSNGLFTTTSAGSGWKAASGADLDVRVVASGPNGTVLAALAKGRVLASQDSGAHWKDVSGSAGTISLADIPIAALAVRPGTPPTWLAAGGAAGLFASSDAGVTWTAIPSPLPSTVPVTGLSALPDGTIAAFGAVDGFVETQWPGWELDATALAVSGSLTGWEGPLVVSQPATAAPDGGTAPVPEQVAVLSVTSVTSTREVLFGAVSSFTRLGVAGSWSPTSFDRAAAQVWLGVDELPLAAQQPGDAVDVADLGGTAPGALGPLLAPAVSTAQVFDGTFDLAGDFRSLLGRTVSVSGLPMRVRATNAGPLPGPVYTLTGALAATTLVQTGPGAPPTPVPLGALRVVGADLTALTKSVVCTVASTTWDGRDTHLVLTPVCPPTLPPFARSSLQLAGNVVSATQGRTVSEVLGSGNARIAWASYTLKAPPVAAIAPGVPDITIAVDGVVWSWVEKLADAKPGARVFALESSPDGTFAVRFGDGERGARVPDGVENVVARYRSGGGVAGNVAASAAVLFQRPTGAIRSASQPVAATGGVDAPLPATALATAQLPLRFVDRLVSIEDYRRFLAAQPGVRNVWSGMRLEADVRWLLLGVSGPDDAPELPAPALAALEDAVRAAAVVDLPVRVLAAPLRLIGARVRVVRAPGMPGVASAVTSAILGTFAPGERAIGADLRARDVAATAREVPGVVRVLDVHLFDPRQPASVLGPRVLARPAGFGPDGPFAPELLAISAADLTVEVLG